MNLTERERMLIVECLQRMDPDTLNDDLDEPTSGSELDDVVRRINQWPTVVGRVGPSL